MCPVLRRSTVALAVVLASRPALADEPAPSAYRGRGVFASLGPDLALSGVSVDPGRTHARGDVAVGYSSVEPDLHVRIGLAASWPMMKSDGKGGAASVIGALGEPFGGALAFGGLARLGVIGVGGTKPDAGAFGYVETFRDLERKRLAIRLLAGADARLGPEIGLHLVLDLDPTPR